MHRYVQSGLVPLACSFSRGALADTVVVVIACFRVQTSSVHCISQRRATIENSTRIGQGRED